MTKRPVLNLEKLPLVYDYAALLDKKRRLVNNLSEILYKCRVCVARAQ